MHSRLLALLLANYVLLASALPAPAPVAAAPPAQYTANPSIGGGSGTYKDSAHFRVYGVDSATADSALKIMEAAHKCFVEEQGWRTPGLSYKTGRWPGGIRYGSVESILALPLLIPLLSFVW